MESLAQAIAVRIPPEILSKIFWENIRALEADDYHFRSNPYLWVPTINVCRHWRDAALGAAQLWSRVIPLNPEWTKQCLDRSQHSPLDIFLLYHRDSSTISRRLAALIVVMREAHHIRSLRLELPAGYTDKLAPIKDLGLQLDALESLDFQIPEVATDGSDSDFLALFMKTAPGLRTLKTRILPTVWVTTRFPAALLHLEVSLAKYDAGIGSMLDALSGMPLLQSLVIVNLPSTRGISSESLAKAERIVNLSHLRILKLDAEASDCAYFLYHLAFPSSTQLVLECLPVDPSQEPKDLALAVAARLGESFRDIPGSSIVRPFRTIAVYLAEHHISRMFTFYAWRSVLTAEDLDEVEFSEEPDIEPDLKVAFQAPIDVPRHEDLSVAGFCGNLPMSSIHVAYIGSMLLKDPTDTLSQALGGLSAVQELIVTARSGRAIPRLMQAEPPLFPVLQQLRLEVVKMIGPDATPGQFVDVLAERRRNGVEIKRLVLRDCVNVKGDDVTALEQVVGEVDWDENAITDDEDASDVDENLENDDEY